MSTSIWNTALNMLARREFSSSELMSKLNQKFPDKRDEIENVLVRLQDLSLQSDQRYSEMWFRTQVGKSRGPIRIRYESRGKGISERIEALIQADTIDWYQMVLEVAERKFRTGFKQEDKAKLYRFLSHRGFDSSMIQHAMDSLEKT